MLRLRRGSGADDLFEEGFQFYAVFSKAADMRQLVQELAKKRIFRLAVNVVGFKMKDAVPDAAGRSNQYVAPANGVRGSVNIGSTAALRKIFEFKAVNRSVWGYRHFSVYKLAVVKAACNNVKIYGCLLLDGFLHGIFLSLGRVAKGAFTSFARKRALPGWTVK